jgi:hypothetical protein
MVLGKKYNCLKAVWLYNLSQKAQVIESLLSKQETINSNKVLPKNQNKNYLNLQI